MDDPKEFLRREIPKLKMVNDMRIVIVKNNWFNVDISYSSTMRDGVDIYTFHDGEETHLGVRYLNLNEMSTLINRMDIRTVNVITYDNEMFVISTDYKEILLERQLKNSKSTDTSDDRAPGLADLPPEMIDMIITRSAGRTDEYSKHNNNHQRPGRYNSDLVLSLNRYPAI
jgi:hypothetical protein